jgi:homoserine O-succinyltransferase/O-acetyltransferase
VLFRSAPVEHLRFEEVNYWDELKAIMDWTTENVTSTMFICWAAQAGFYHFYNVPKHPLPKKMFGVFHHNVNDRHIPLVRGFDDRFLAPHSRLTETRREDVEKDPELEIISESDVAGLYIAGSKSGKQIFVTGHSEYDPLTLKMEYERDVKKGIDIEVPRNYFPDDDPSQTPLVKWRSHANLLYTNWINYYVYQRTPFVLD